MKLNNCNINLEVFYSLISFIQLISGEDVLIQHEKYVLYLIKHIIKCTKICSQRRHDQTLSILTLPKTTFREDNT